MQFVHLKINWRFWTNWFRECVRHMPLIVTRIWCWNSWFISSESVKREPSSSPSALVLNRLYPWSIFNLVSASISVLESFNIWHSNLSNPYLLDSYLESGYYSRGEDAVLTSNMHCNPAETGEPRWNFTWMQWCNNLKTEILCCQE